MSERQAKRARGVAAAVLTLGLLTVPQPATVAGRQTPTPQQSQPSQPSQQSQPQPPPQSQTPAAGASELEEAKRLAAESEKLYGAGKYAESQEAMERALSIRERLLGRDHPDTATLTGNLGELAFARADYARSEELFRRALDVRERKLGPEHPLVAESLNNLAMVYNRLSDTPRSERMYRRALAIREKISGPDDPSLATVINNIGAIYYDRGDYASAEPLYLRALALREKGLGPAHPLVANSLNNLAALYKQQGDRAKAEQFYLRSLALYEARLGPEHPDLTMPLNNLAIIYDDAGDDARAEGAYRRSLAIDEKALGPDHPTVSVDLNNLGGFYEIRGDYDRAVPLYERALSIRERKLGARHPRVAVTLSNLAIIHEARGEIARALELRTRVAEIREYNLGLVLQAGSEQQKQLYLATIVGDFRASISLHTRRAPRDAGAARLALTSVLRWKGRALDAMADQLGALRRRLDPQDRALLDELSAARARLSALVLAGAGKASPAEHAASLTKLEAEVQRLEAAVGARSAEFGAQAQPVTLEEVRRSIPAGAALVELITYRPFDPRGRRRETRVGPRRYAAYVLRSAGDPLWADLGDAEAIDEGVRKLRAALSSPARRDFKELARALDERVMRPVRALLGPTTHLFVSPDGDLNLVPFGALVDEQGRYLVERFSLTYLTSGRDLLRLRARAASRSGPVVFADPLFGAASASPTTMTPPPAGVAASAGTAPSSSSSSPLPGARRSADFGQLSFTQLKGTAEEGRALRTTLAGVRLLTGAEATESALKNLAAPSVLHVATHGFFLPDAARADTLDARGLSLAPPPAGGAGARGENPLLRSGVALAGANNLGGGAGEDGVLTALEAAGLDLWGTRLVVLSACETGVGEIRNGEGVYGLRRALVLAGSESQVMSLWQVSDAATRDLMIDYYRRLRRGEGRTEALRQVQLSMIRGRLAAGARRGAAQRGIGVGPGRAAAVDRSHPFYWASFIGSGDWRPMIGGGGDGAMKTAAKGARRGRGAGRRVARRGPQSLG